MISCRSNRCAVSQTLEPKYLHVIPYKEGGTLVLGLKQTIKHQVFDRSLGCDVKVDR